MLDIINNTKSKRQENKLEIEKKDSLESAKSESTSKSLGKFIVTNNSSKRISVTLKLKSENKKFSKQFVLSNGDKETFKNLAFGTYEYSAKFEDGTIAKSGEFELNGENKIIEKEIK